MNSDTSKPWNYVKGSTFCTNEQGAELVRGELRTLFSLLHFSLWLGSKGEIHACEQYVKLIVNSLVSPVLWKTLYTASNKPLNLINLNGKDCEFGAVRFHQCWSYLNNNCLLIDLPFLLELIHFLNFDFLVYLSSDDEMMELQSSSTPRNAISTGMNCNECNSLPESFQVLKWLHNIFSLSL